MASAARNRLVRVDLQHACIEAESCCGLCRVERKQGSEGVRGKCNEEESSRCRLGWPGPAEGVGKGSMIDLEDQARCPNGGRRGGKRLPWCRRDLGRGQRTILYRFQDAKTGA